MEILVIGSILVCYLYVSINLKQEGGMEHSVFGQWLGWLMAAIYMGGRIPQICLNVSFVLSF